MNYDWARTQGPAGSVREQADEGTCGACGFEGLGVLVGWDDGAATWECGRCGDAQPAGELD